MLAQKLEKSEIKVLENKIKLPHVTSAALTDDVATNDGAGNIEIQTTGNWVSE